MKTRFTAIVLVAAVARNSIAAIVTDAGLKHAQEAQRHDSGITPKLENVASDKGFFGPPFPADYPHDSQPVLAPDMARLKRDGIYPKVQESGFLDHDYVKDENGDGGEWKAQMDYDESRVKVSEEERLNEKRKKEAEREREAYEKAQKEAEEARAAADKAKKEAEASDKDAKEKEDAKDASEKSEASNKKAAEEAKHKAAEKAAEEETIEHDQEALEKKVKEAEEKFQDQQKAYEQCKKDYDEAKAELEELKKKLAALEGDVSASSTHLLAGSQDTERLRSQALAAKARTKAASAALSAASEKFAKAETARTMQKMQTDRTEEAAKKQNEYLENAKAKMEAAKASLRKIRGFDPKADPTPRSSAAAGTASRFLIALLSLRLLM